MKTIRTLLALLGAAALAAAAGASTLITLDTSGLAAGTYYIDFQLNDGDGTNPNTNTALITHIDLGGGTIDGPAFAYGGVSGDLSSSVALTDTDWVNEFFQAFIPGTFVSFQLSLSNNWNGVVPDIFGFAILDSNLMNLETYSLGSDQLLVVEQNGAGLGFQTYASVDGSLPAPGVPDSGATALFVVAGLVGLFAVRSQRRVA
jgi:hypothetical protein